MLDFAGCEDSSAKLMHVMEVRPEPWIENRASRAWIQGIRFREAWSYRGLALFFAVRELKLRYKQTVLGVLWALLQPLLTMALFSIVLEQAVHIPSQGIPYPVFAYVGLSVWSALTTGVSRAADSLTEDPALVRNVYFPRLLAPTGAVISMTPDLVLGLLLIAPLMALYGVTPSAGLLLLPLCTLALAVVALAVGIWLSALHVLYRDVRYVMGFGLQAWLFATPVLFPSSIVTGPGHDLMFLNPAAGMIEAFRAAILGTPVDAGGLAISAGATLMIGITGLAYFGRTERRFADRV